MDGFGGLNMFNLAGFGENNTHIVMECVQLQSQLIEKPATSLDLVLV